METGLFKIRFDVGRHGCDLVNQIIASEHFRPKRSPSFKKSFHFGLIGLPLTGMERAATETKG
jgi:hypothetical protein